MKLKEYIPRKVWPPSRTLTGTVTILSVPINAALKLNQALFNLVQQLNRGKGLLAHKN